MIEKNNEEIKKYPLEKCIENFRKYILGNELNTSQKSYIYNNKKDLLSFGIKGNLSSIYIRPMIYKIFLNHLPIDKSLQQWISITATNRISYTQLKTKYFSSYKNNSKLANNLANSNSKEDNKHNIENDEEIKNIINLDLSRTFQEISLFKDQKIITILFNILYIYNMEHSNTNPYKQGMNEILSILFFSIYPCYFPCKTNLSKNDIINKIDTYNKKSKSDINKKSTNLKKKINISESDKKIVDILFYFFHDENYLEIDLYYLFTELMEKGFNIFYKDDYLQKRCDTILNNKLKIIDYELYKHCINIKVPYQIFLGKWIQSFYNQVTNIYNCIKILDIIISQEFLKNDIDIDIYYIKKNDINAFEYLDCICLSMIKKYREELLKKNNEEFLIFCVTYPEIKDLNEIIQSANNINLTIQTNKIDIHKINENSDKKSSFANNSNKKLFLKKPIKNKIVIKTNTSIYNKYDSNSKFYKDKKLKKNHTIVGNIEPINNNNITPSKSLLQSNKSTKLLEKKNSKLKERKYSFLDKVSSLTHQFDEYKNNNDLIDTYYF